MNKEGTSKDKVTSDLHFFHKNILTFAKDTRPFVDMEDMIEKLIEEWNDNVDDDTTIYHLGDFSFGNATKTEEVLKRLKGKKVFILGNHDNNRQVRKLLEQYGETHHYKEIKVNGVKVVMSHYPMVVWNQSHFGSVMLFGHVHGSYEGVGRTVDVGYDNFGKIMLLEDVVNICLEKEIYTPSHHRGE